MTTDHANTDQLLNGEGQEFLPPAAKKLEELIQIFKQGRLAHALLFAGQEGIGKRAVAEALVARILSDTARTPERTPALLSSGTHPDLHRLAPLEDKKTISVDQVRELSSKLDKTPQLGSLKTAIISPAEAMTTAAANALLKTLEEPPGNSLLILISHNKGWLPQTIRSRCQVINLTMTNTEVLSWLANDNQDPETSLEAATGSPLKAQDAHESGLSEDYRRFVEEFKKVSMGQGDAISCALSMKSVEIAQLLSWIDGVSQAMVRRQMLSQENTLDYRDNILNKLNINLDTVNLQAIYRFQDYLRASQRQLQANLNPDLFLEEIMVRWSNLVRSPVH